jgi:hypothetical protein
VSPSSLVDDGLDGSGVDSLEGEESLSGIALENSSITTDEINWVFDPFTGGQGPGTSQPFVLGLWSDMFTSIVALIFGLHFWVFFYDAWERGRTSPAPSSLLCLYMMLC